MYFGVVMHPNLPPTLEPDHLRCRFLKSQSRNLNDESQFELSFWIPQNWIKCSPRTGPNVLGKLNGKGLAG